MLDGSVAWRNKSKLIDSVKRSGELMGECRTLLDSNANDERHPSGTSSFTCSDTSYGEGRRSCSTGTSSFSREDVPSENGGNRLGNDVHGTKGGGQEGLRCGAAHQGQRREGEDVVLVCVPKDVNACEKSVLSSGLTAFELRTSTSSASVPFQDDSRQLRGR
ncbi:hypothetical protein GQ600_12939 [Phytophthora cactorum]|nr:hypothetical protein GQ600_12939 [Phytophthora cactorum]